MRKRTLLITSILLLSFLVLPGGASAVAAPPRTEPVSYAEKTIKTSGGVKTVKVITVDPKDPTVRFEVNTPGSLLNVTEDFATQVQAKKPFAAVNANFFLAYDTIKDPIGHVMVDGKLIHGQSGITSLGITKNKDLVFGMPGIFTGLYGDGLKQNTRDPDTGSYRYNVWSAYEVNTLSQMENGSILYTPARGSSVKIRKNGWVSTVRNGVLQSFIKVAVGTIVPIPKDGYVAFYGYKLVDSWKGDKGLEPGRKINMEYYLYNKDKVNPAFKLEDMQWMVSGGPDLVTDGKIAPVSTHPAFSDTRFTTKSTPRTAVGVTGTGKMLLVSATSVKINELKEIMLALGAKNSINLDGGASTAMYYDGKILASPGRKLATLLYIYKK